jgi:hypothetical protein
LCYDSAAPWSRVFVLSDNISAVYTDVFSQPDLSSQIGLAKLGYSRIFLDMLLQRADSLFKISSSLISLFIDRADVCMTQTPAEAACDAAVVQVRRIATAVAG